MMITVFTAANAAYLHHAQALLASFRHYYPDARCMVYGVDLAENSRDELVRYGATLVSPVRTPPVDSVIRAACWRFCAVLEGMSNNQEHIIIAFDADTIVRGRFGSVFEALSSADVALRLRRGRNPNRRVYAGVVGLRSTPGARLFLQTYEQLLNNDEPTWYADQRCLFNAYRKLKGSSAVNFVDIVGIQMERGRRLHEDAIVWCPNGSMRRSARFRRESCKWQSVFADDVRGNS